MPCSETEDVWFETMAVSIFVDCVVIEEACRIGDSISSMGYHGLDCQTGVIKRTVALSSIIV